MSWPHSGQNLALAGTVAPQLVQALVFGSGFFVPQLVQNLPVFSVPHSGQNQAAEPPTSAVLVAQLVVGPAVEPAVAAAVASVDFAFAVGWIGTIDPFRHHLRYPCLGPYLRKHRRRHLR